MKNFPAAENKRLNEASSNKKIFDKAAQKDLATGTPPSTIHRKQAHQDKCRKKISKTRQKLLQSWTPPEENPR